VAVAAAVVVAVVLGGVVAVPGTDAVDAGVCDELAVLLPAVRVGVVDGPGVAVAVAVLAGGVGVPSTVGARAETNG